MSKSNLGNKIQASKTGDGYQAYIIAPTYQKSAANLNKNPCRATMVTRSTSHFPWLQGAHYTNNKPNSFLQKCKYFV